MPKATRTKDSSGKVRVAGKLFRDTSIGRFASGASRTPPTRQQASGRTVRKRAGATDSSDGQESPAEKKMPPARQTSTTSRPKLPPLSRQKRIRLQHEAEQHLMGQMQRMQRQPMRQRSTR